ncbi:uncharacterized protein LOC120140699 [Hibiscus syriacus]|uniref:uncharacterized protein LOC120140699 n=1 Tax=Hibiscus syriacus TaxID=106335 RepID=UPI001924FBB1|nr:uncharacterized protein LOC120140699 [Hibiscus syriacus]
MAVITSSLDTLSLDRVYSMLVDEETQLVGFDSQPENFPTSTNVSHGQIYGRSIGSENLMNSSRNHQQCVVVEVEHGCNVSYVDDSSSANYVNLDSVTCTCCANKSGTSSVATQGAAFPCTNVTSARAKWIMNSGAMHNATLDAAHINYSTDLDGLGNLVVGNGSSLSVQLVGQSILRSSSQTLLLTDLLHVPEITKHLLSVSKLAKDNHVFFEFHADTCCVRDEVTCHVLLQGRRLGHPTFSTLKLVCNSITVDIPNNVNQLCVAYCLDLWGPSPEPSAGFRYYISFVDACTRHTLFKHMVETQFSLPIKAIQSDWGGEYRNWKEELAHAGVLHRVTCPHLSEQNGVVEPVKQDSSHHVVSSPRTTSLEGIPRRHNVYPTTVEPILEHSGASSQASHAENEVSHNDELDHFLEFLDHSTENSLMTSPPLVSAEGVNESVQNSVEDASVPDQVPLTNTHPMVTRSKHGIFKPKVLLAMEDTVIPTDIHQDMKSSKWTSAVHNELAALQRNGTWTLVPLPIGRTTVGCKWLFKQKKNPDGSIQRYKARLAAKDITNKWPLRHVDVNNAFLHGDWNEEVFMQQPPGFEQLAEDETKLVCKLHKALYGLRQAPRNWNNKLKDSLLQMGFQMSREYASLFISLAQGEVTYILVYVDDIVITGQSVTAIERVVQSLKLNF